MGAALGFRVEPKQINWAVVEGTRQSPILSAYDKASAPVGLSEAAALSWYRERARYLVAKYAPAAAGIRSPEPIARGAGESARKRLRIEGVLLEAMDSCSVEVTAAALATISSRLGAKTAKRYVESGEFRGLDLSKIPAALREAVLVGVSALPPG